ncbi:MULTISPECIES: hypothetical protein [unclassified Streptomyces]|uniref:hypothetical protein n=1 Tax=unclassified Streptomyces TaxID=2593676 RepID=UPI000DAB5280|nr:MULTISPECIES: hypothetical protein [unclassified Streptomyces]PZT77851.1 hypothetical protein DNK56_32490 [Streptomyces sp. AC1-42W]PZT78198.1 hypothetical protein DNK55_00200 [Streptomyces sp. AC1-42T]
MTTTGEPGEGVRRTARDRGLVPALTALHAELAPGMLPLGPAGHVLLPEAVAADARGVRRGTRTAPRDRAAESAPRTVRLHGDVLVALRHPLPPGPENTGDTWGLGLARLRLGLSEALLDTCLEYLSARTSGGSPLLMRQLVQDSLSEALTDHLEMDGLLGPGARLTAGELCTLHRAVTRTDRVLLRLLGGHGFRADGPGQISHVSELLADVYAAAPAATEESP